MDGATGSEEYTNQEEKIAGIAFRSGGFYSRVSGENRINSEGKFKCIGKKEDLIAFGRMEESIRSGQEKLDVPAYENCTAFEEDEDSITFYRKDGKFDVYKK